MKMKVSNYIAQKLVEEGISQVFSVTGGGAMHLNDALGHQEGLTCMYNHHEQACAIAAESYARIHGKIAAVCVTTGPGGTNAITGVVGGWLDSIPMFVLSGQVRYDTTARWSGVGIRARLCTCRIPEEKAPPGWTFPWIFRDLTWRRRI